jgi:hypothetical protein
VPSAVDSAVDFPLEGTLIQAPLKASWMSECRARADYCFLTS